MAKRSIAKKRGRAEWAEIIRRWGRSGLSGSEFAAPLGVDPATLTWWRWRLRADGVGATAPSGPRLARVRVQPGVPAEPIPADRQGYDWELMTADGDTLRVRRGVPADELREVLAALGRRRRP
jgi:hypothetical protein